MKVLVVDYGGAYSHYVGLLLSQMNIRWIRRSWEHLNLREIVLARPTAVILSASSLDQRPPLPRGLLRLKLPTLGICNGAQLLARHYNGQVTSIGTGEFGLTALRIHERGALLEGVPDLVWMHHLDAITYVPNSLRVLASTALSPVAAFEDTARRVYGVQFHPEVPEGAGSVRLVERFVRGLNSRAKR